MLWHGRQVATGANPGDDAAWERTGVDPGDDAAREKTGVDPGDDAARERPGVDPGDDAARERTGVEGVDGGNPGASSQIEAVAVDACGIETHAHGTLLKIVDDSEVMLELGEWRGRLGKGSWI